MKKISISLISSLLLLSNLQANEVNLDMNKGWNLISIPIKEDLSDLSKFGNYETVYTFKNGEWIKNPRSISYGEGVWVKHSDTQKLTFSGEEYDISTKFNTLSDGWNLLGSGSDIENISDYNFKNIFTFQNNLWQNNPSIINRGVGFWVNKDSSIYREDFGEIEIVDTIETISNDSIIDVNKKDDIANLTLDDITQTEDENRVIVNIDEAKAKENIEKPLFVNDEFRGIIESVETNSGNVEYVTREANDVTEVYDNFKLTFSTDEIASSIQRSLQNKKLGIYDDINKKPLKVSLQKRAIKNQRGITKQELIMRVDIPRGYKIPLREAGDMTIEIDGEASVSTDIWDVKGEATVSGAITDKLDLGITKTFPENSEEDSTYNLTVSTDGSYVEFGIGSLIEAMYDVNIGDDSFYFKLENSAYFTSHLDFELNGEYADSWEKPLNLLKGFNVEIRHPYSTAVKTSIFFRPDIIIGGSGSANGKVEIDSTTTRKGTIGITYDSENGVNPYKSGSIEPSGMNINTNIQVDGSVYLFPEIGISPKIEFLRIKAPLSFGFIRSGIRVDGNLHGEISDGFTIKNTEFNNKFDAGLNINLITYPYVDYKLNIKVGNNEIYKPDSDYKELWKGDSKTIFDWSLDIIEMPQVVVTDIDKNTKEVSFAVEDKNRENIYFIYTLDGSEPSLINGNRYENTPIQVTSNTTIKVVGIMQNSSNAFLKMSTSISKVATQDVIFGDTPTIAENQTNNEEVITTTTNDCQTQLSNLYINDHYQYDWYSEIFSWDSESITLGEGEYEYIGVSSLDGIAIDKNTKITIYSKPNFEGQILLEKEGPAVINNVKEKENEVKDVENGILSSDEVFMSDWKEPWQSLFPQSVRDYSSDDMHEWVNGSIRVECK